MVDPTKKKGKKKNLLFSHLIKLAPNPNKYQQNITTEEPIKLKNFQNHFFFFKKLIKSLVGGHRNKN